MFGMHVTDQQFSNRISYLIISIKPKTYKEGAGGRCMLFQNFGKEISVVFDVAMTTAGFQYVWPKKVISSFLHQVTEIHSVI